MKPFYFLLGFLLSCLMACHPGQTPQQNSSIESSIKKVLMEQQMAWNEGQIDRFMEGYWNSDSLTFSGRNGLTKGWQTTLENYKKSYPDTSAMGKLTFDISETDVAGPEFVVMKGKFTLKRKADTPSGFFMLIWQIKHGKWVITSDFTCGS